MTYLAGYILSSPRAALKVCFNLSFFLPVLILNSKFSSAGLSKRFAQSLPVFSRYVGVVVTIPVFIQSALQVSYVRQNYKITEEEKEEGEEERKKEEKKKKKKKL